MTSILVAIFFMLKVDLMMGWEMIESDTYSLNGDFIVMEPPYDVLTHLGSIVTLDPVGSYHVVSNGVAYYFDEGQLRVSDHKWKPRYKYLAVESIKIPTNVNYNLFTNNCKQFKL